MVVIHIFYLHINGSSNPLGVNSSTYKVPFHYYFTVKDAFVFLVFIFALIFVTLNNGYSLMDAEN